MMTTNTRLAALAFLALLPLSQVSAVAAVISVNLGADVGGGATAVGSNPAGVIAVNNWNDVPLAQQTNAPLRDSSGATVPGLTLSTSETFVYPASAFDSGANFGPSQAGSTAMMRGHVYHTGGANLDLKFTGQVPYTTFDLYVYYNSGGITNAQTFSILDGSGGSLGLSRAGSEVPGTDAAYVLSDGAGNNANYVKFTGLTSAQVPANFIIRASGGTFTYFDGVQIVQTAPAISLNFGSDVSGPATAVGANTAGVVPVANWNDVPIAQQTNMPLKDSSGNTVTGLTLSTSQTFTVPASASDSLADFGAWAPGDSAMMRGHIYRGGGSNLDLTFTGRVPYDLFDLYIYYNSGAVANTQTFSILDGSGNSLGLSQTVFETPGPDSGFIYSDGSLANANYVRFVGLTSASIPANFIVRVSGAAYTYIDGLQFVSLPVPEPSSLAMALFAACGLAGWVRLDRRRGRAV